MTEQEMMNQMMEKAKSVNADCILIYEKGWGRCYLERSPQLKGEILEALGREKPYRIGRPYWEVYTLSTFKKMKWNNFWEGQRWCCISCDKNNNIHFFY